MFDIHHSKLDLQNENEIIHKVINLDAGLDACILIDSEDNKIATIAFNTILDALLGQITKDDTYKQFSGALENINMVFKTWQNDGDKIKGLNMFIGILTRKNLIFSTMGKPSGYLIKRDGEIVEILDKGDLGKKEFSFISSGDINEGEVLILGSNLSLDDLSKSDLRESALMESADTIIKNIESILAGENLERNIGFFVLKNDYFAPPKEETKLGKYFSTSKHVGMKLLDNRPVKKLVALSMIGKEKVEAQGQLLKGIGFLLGIFVTFFLLYSIISGVLGNTTASKDVETSKQNLIQAREFIRLANENVANPDIFELNMKKAEDLVYEIKDKELFLNDINKILEDITIIKKQFNGVESFDNTEDKLLVKGIPGNAVRVLENKGKAYVVTSNSIIGPIIPGSEPKTVVFTQLGNGESFKDAAVSGDNIVLLTTQSKVVNFTKSGFFQFADSLGQKTWQESNELESFNTNIYLLNKDETQIFKHKKSGDNFDAGSPYLKEDDVKNIGKILSIGIDGGIYILKSDLSLLKVFGAPKYRVESILINKIPKNYNLESNPEATKIKVRGDLAYVYMLLNNKVWVFQPNTKLFQDTKSLTYIGQIEAKSGKIQDFYVSHDGELLTLTETGLYTLKFEVSNNKVIVR